MSRRFTVSMRRWILVTSLVALALPPAASAQEGVFVDPDSPSGKEYEIPLESARRHADPARTSGKVAAGERSSPLFGEGVGEDPTGETSGGAGSGSRDGAARRRGSTGGALQAVDELDEPAREVVRRAASRPATPVGGGDVVLLIGSGALVLVAGAVGGYTLRRAGSPRRSA